MTARRAAGLLLAAFLAIYLPDVGHGFLRDDFAWIHGSRLQTLGDLPGLFGRDNGFFRPLVALTFAIDHAVHGLRPFGFALTNVVLLLVAALVLFRLARALGLGQGAAVLAAGLWLLNPHGVPMALLWISGRTSILLSLFALLAAWALVRGRTMTAGALTLLALLSKEEALLLPFILLAWTALGTAGSARERWTAAARAAWPSLLVLVPYLLLRAGTRAYLPHTAPGFYRLSLDPALLARNAAEYLDRSCTLAAGAVLLLWLIVRRRPALDDAERTTVARGLVWLVLGFGITVFLPVRSSLYALFPSIGSVLAAAALAQSLWRDAAPRARRWIPMAAVLLPFAALPVYRTRAVRWVQPADLSRQALEDLRRDPPDPKAVTVLHDIARHDRGLAAAFGTLLPEALALHGWTATVWIDPPPPGSSPAAMDTSGAAAVHHRFLRDGRLVNPFK